MYQIIEGMVSELKKEDVKITYNTEIESYSEANGKLEYLVDKKGKKWFADTVHVNADAAVFRNRVFKREKYSDKKMAKMNWTMGYLTFYIGIKCKLPQVNHHNYYLGSNYEEYSNNILQNPDTLEKPYYYVNVLSKLNPQCAPEGCETLFFVCPVPNLLFKTDWSDSDNIVTSIIADFSKRIGKDISSEIVSKTVYTPEDWQNQFNLYKGSGLGLSHTMKQIGAFRPSNFDEKFKNVFYVGASTLPGAGLPMAIISSKLAFKRIEKYMGRLGCNI
jgi:phytoene desaturase